MRSWRKRDVATLGGRTGFVKQAIRSGVPILPVATVGGHDTVFVLVGGQVAGRRAGQAARAEEDAARRQPADHRRLPVPARRRDPAGAPAAAGEDPHRAARADRGRRRPGAGRRRGVRAEDLRPGGARHPGRHGPAGRQAHAAGPGMSGGAAGPGVAGGARRAGVDAAEALAFFDGLPAVPVGGDDRPVAGERAGHRLAARRAARGLRLVRQGVPRRGVGAPAAVPRPERAPAAGRPAAGSRCRCCATTPASPTSGSSAPRSPGSGRCSGRRSRRRGCGRSSTGAWSPRRWSTTPCRSSTSSGG